MLILCGLLSCLSLCAQRRYLNEATDIVKEISLDKFKDLSLKVLSSELSKVDGISKEKEAYYIYTSPEKKKGFVIISGDKRMPAILGYSDNNDFDVNKIKQEIKNRHCYGCYELTDPQRRRKIRVDKIVKHARNEVKCVSATEYQRGKAHQFFVFVSCLY